MTTGSPPGTDPPVHPSHDCPVVGRTGRTGVGEEKRESRDGSVDVEFRFNFRRLHQVSPKGPDSWGGGVVCPFFLCQRPSGAWGFVESQCVRFPLCVFENLLLVPLSRRRTGRREGTLSSPWRVYRVWSSPDCLREVRTHVEVLLQKHHVFYINNSPGSWN